MATCIEKVAKKAGAANNEVVMRRKKSGVDLHDPNKGFPPEEVSEYREVFDYFDTAHKGIITGKQLATTLRTLNPKPDEKLITEQVRKVDENLKGVCKFEDFLESIHTTIRATKKRERRKTIYTNNISEQRIGEIRDAFDMFDYDNDETISLDELQSVMNSCGIYITEEEARDIIMEYSHTGGSLNFQDFLKLMSHKETGGVNSEIMEAFRFFDKDGDGHITPDEIKTVMTALGEDITDNEILEMVQEADTDGGGSVSYEDFLKIITG